jgi:hypothetical protein
MISRASFIRSFHQELHRLKNSHSSIRNIYRTFSCTSSSPRYSSETPHVCIVGAGPAGFYTAQQILKVGIVIHQSNEPCLSSLPRKHNATQVAQSISCRFG